MTTASLGDTGSAGAGSWLSEHRNEAIIGGFVILGAAVYLYEKHKSSGSTGSTITALLRGELAVGVTLGTAAGDAPAVESLEGTVVIELEPPDEDG